MLAAGGSDEAAWFMKDSGNLSRMVEREVKGLLEGALVVAMDTIALNKSIHCCVKLIIC